jgi:hypothetical protein
MSGKPQKKVTTDGFPPNVPHVRPGQVRDATGTDNFFLQQQLINQVVRAVWMPDGIGQEEQNKRIVAAIALMEGIRPQDAIESMLTVQMVATHNAALDCLHRAMLPHQTFEGRNQNLKHGVKLLAIYAQQTAALDKHRGKGQQKVTVEHVHVEAGGQAIVGHVERGRAAGRRLKGASVKPEQLNASTGDAPQPFRRSDAEDYERTDDGED